MDVFASVLLKQMEDMLFRLLTQHDIDDSTLTADNVQEWVQNFFSRLRPGIDAWVSALDTNSMFNLIHIYIDDYKNLTTTNTKQILFYMLLIHRMILFLDNIGIHVAIPWKDLVCEGFVLKNAQKILQ